MTPQETIRAIEEEFQLQNSWEDRYEHIIAVGRGLPVFPEVFRTEVFKVKGCQAQVWLHPSFDGKCIHFEADSDATIVKGLLALLMRVYNHRTPAEVLATEPSFIEVIGLHEHLSQNRTNGLFSMLKQVKMYAAAYQAVARMGASA
ncbi:MAG: SufE family protein [bacterium]|nr:SufE family protein [bacterium]